MNFTHRELQLLALALDNRIDDLRRRARNGDRQAKDLATENLTLQQRIERHIRDTALPTTSVLNRDTAGELWA